jgi:Macrocin-O-methyltransferase (TylF)
VATVASAHSCRELYLDLLKRTLLGLTYEDDSRLYPEAKGQAPKRVPHDADRRLSGADWPSAAHTMIGLARMDNIQQCIERVIAEKVPGDLIETGVWRGGAVIFMRGVLRAYGVDDRVVWAADSFEGLPRPDVTRYPQDKAYAGVENHKELAVSLEAVQANFDRYQLLDDAVRFLKGWFRDTLPPAPIQRLALMRLDGDLYESTMDALTHLYPKLSPGGFVIIDDYNIGACRAAVADFRAAHRIEDPIEAIDWAGVYWRRTR